MKYTYSIAVLCCLCASVALGEPVVVGSGSGWASEDGYVWGATARNMNSSAADWELGVGNDSAMSEVNSHIDWGGAGTAHDFLLDYNPTRDDQVIWAMDGMTNILSNPGPLFNDIFLQLSISDSYPLAYIGISNASVAIGGVDLLSLDDFAVGAGELETRQYLRISDTDRQLSDVDFILEGTLNIDWSGDAPERSHMAMYVKMVQIPEPASIAMVILVSATGLFIRRRFFR